MKTIAQLSSIAGVLALLYGCGGQGEGQAGSAGEARLRQGASLAAAHQFGNVSAVNALSPNTFEVDMSGEKIKIQFYRPDVIKLHLPQGGAYTEETGTKIVDYQPDDSVVVTKSDAGAYIKLESSEIVLRVYKSPMRLAAYKKDNQSLIWEEKTPLSIAPGAITQTFTHQDGEAIYGGGMINGEFTHTGKVVPIVNGNVTQSDNGVNSNPVPFFMSSNGYGVLRNTFAYGVYDFSSDLTITHDSGQVNTYIFMGGSLKKVLEHYTQATGRAPLIPHWGLGYGDANCYNKSSGPKLGDLFAIAKNYVNQGFPRGWFLPNDGYGCGYTDLASTVQTLAADFFHTGLWTENDVTKIALEVGTYGSRLVKTDVAWVGRSVAGYSGREYSLEAQKKSYEGIENNSSERGMVMSILGWAGSQRYAAVWPGDNYGTWDKIAFEIPAVVGAGLSGMNYSAVDVDGIFGGSPKTYVRQMQWASWISMMYGMSGWAAQNRQPWVHGEPYTGYNKAALVLREKLKPYFYTYLREAQDTGAPLVRSTAFEFEGDRLAREKLFDQQFLSGPAFLIAPVVQDAEVRDNIYLPRAKWIDYWDGTVYYGSKLLNGYAAPLSKIPVFVRGGSIIPMNEELNANFEPNKAKLTIEVYPYKNSSFSLYEDDGISKLHRSGQFARTLIEASEPGAADSALTIKLGATSGSYQGQSASREYKVVAFVKTAPTSVLVNGASAIRLESKAALEAASSGWFYDSTLKGGALLVKPGSRPISVATEIKAYGLQADTTPLADDFGATALAPNTLAGASASSSTAAGPATAAFDGNAATDWVSAGLTSGGSQYAQTAITTFQTVNAVQYTPSATGKGRITAYEVYTSDDNLNFKLVSSGTWANDASTKKASFNATLTRYVRLVAKASSDSYVAAAEISLGRPLGTDPAIVPAAAFTISASSTQTGTPATALVDGNPASIWHSLWSTPTVSANNPLTLNLQFARATQISAIKYLPRQDGGTNGIITAYSLLGSSDGINFSLLKDGTLAADKSMKTIAFAGPPLVALRLQITGGVGGFASGAELQVVRDLAPKSKVVADGVTAVADTEQSGEEAKNAIDGSEGSMWHSNYSQATLPAGITIALKKNRIVNALSYLPRQDQGDNGKITQYQVLLSNDGVNFTAVKTGSFLLDRMEKVVQFPAQRASFVRLVASAAVGNYVSAAELKVYEDLSVPNALFSQAGFSVSASSSAAGQEIAKLKDGNPTTYWASVAGSALPVSVTTDFGAARTVSGVLLQPYTSASPTPYITGCEVQVSLDGTNFVSVANANLATNQAEKNIGFAPVSARYVRILANRSSGNYVSLGELNFY